MLQHIKKIVLFWLIIGPTLIVLWKIDSRNPENVADAKIVQTIFINEITGDNSTRISLLYLFFLSPLTEEIAYRGPVWLLTLIFPRIRFRNPLLLITITVSTYLWAFGYNWRSSQPYNPSHAFPLLMFFVGLGLCFIMIREKNFLLLRPAPRNRLHLWARKLYPLLLVIFIHLLGNIIVLNGLIIKAIKATP